MVQLLGLFENKSSMLIQCLENPWMIHESSLFQGFLLQKIRASDLLIADRVYCSFVNFTQDRIQVHLHSDDISAAFP